MRFTALLPFFSTFVSVELYIKNAKTQTKQVSFI